MRRGRVPQGLVSASHSGRVPVSSGAAHSNGPAERHRKALSRTKDDELIRIAHVIEVDTGLAHFMAAASVALEFLLAA